MDEKQFIKTARFVFDDDLLSVDEMDRDQLIQALEWTLEAAENNKKAADKFEKLLKFSKS